MFKNKQVQIVSLLVLFLGFPMLYLFVKTSKTNNTPKEQPVNISAPVSSMAALENAAKESPNFDNLINLSLAYINNKMPGKSINLLQKAIELNPKSAIAYNNLGVAFIMTQQYQNGIDACTSAIALDPNFQLAKNNLKWGTDEKNKALEAIKQLEQKQGDKKDVNFYINLGMSYYKINNFDKSIEVWKKVLDIDPKNTIALNNIGSAFMLKKQVDDAMVFFKKVLEVEPTNQLAKNNLAWALDEKKKK